MSISFYWIEENQIFFLEAMCLTKRAPSHKYQKNLGKYLNLKNLEYKLMKKFVNYINEIAFYSK